MHLQLTIQFSCYSNSLLDYPFLKCQIFPILRYMENFKYWNTGFTVNCYTRTVLNVLFAFDKNDKLYRWFYIFVKIKWTIFRFDSSVSIGLSIYWIYMYMHIYIYIYTLNCKKSHLSIINLNETNFVINKKSWLHYFVSYFSSS